MELTRVGSEPRLSEEEEKKEVDVGDVVIERSGERSLKMNTSNKRSTKELENLWQGEIQLFCGLRGVSSGMNNSAPGLVLFAQIAVTVLLFVFPIRYLTDQFTHSPYLVVLGALFSLLTITFFLRTAFSDPGIMPNCNVKGDPAAPAAFQSRPPRKQNFIAHGKPVGKTYCDSCNIYQPPLTVHCSICKNCVNRFDHHCPWVGNCIGVRNYRYFLSFLFSASTALVFSLVLAVLQLVRVASREESETEKYVNGIGAIVLVIVSSILLLFVLALVAFHIQLLRNNITTFEQLKVTDRLLRPHGRGFRAIRLILFGPRGESYVKRWIEANQMVSPSAPAVEAPCEKVYSLGNEAVAKHVPLSSFDPSRFFPAIEENERRDTFLTAYSDNQDANGGSLSNSCDELESVTSYEKAEI